MRYTVKQLADIAGVTPRTLHYYDEIGLLKPDAWGDNGYRYYEEQSIFRLQQILFFREFGFPLKEITAVIDQPDFETINALETHKQQLEHKADRIVELIKTIDDTIAHLKGEITMSKKDIFAGFTPEREAEYAEEARQRYGAESVNASYKRWNRYSPEKQAAIKAETAVIYETIVADMDKGWDSDEVQKQVAALHKNMGYFFDCSYDWFQGLGNMYRDDPKFRAFYEAIHPDMPDFLCHAISCYCQRAANE